MDVYYEAMAIVAALERLSWFCGGWFIIYVLLGSWMIVLVLRPSSDPTFRLRRQVWIHLAVHVLFCINYMNPFVILNLVGITAEGLADYLIIAAYCGLLPILFSLLIFRLLPRWRPLAWLSWKPPLGKELLIHAVACAVSFGAGCLAVVLFY